MEMTQLASTQSAPAKKPEASQRTESKANSDASDFDRHLNEQIDQHKPVDKSAESRGGDHKVQENQQHSSHQREESTPVGQQESATEVTEEILPVDEGILVAGHEMQLEIDTKSVDVEAIETIIVDDAPEQFVLETEQQILPEDGNALPLTIKAEQFVQQQSEQPVQHHLKEAAVVKAVANQTQTKQDNIKQPNLAEALLVDKETPIDGEDFIAPEVKTQVKNNQFTTNQLLQGKAGIALASVAASASTQQQVAATTAASSINLHTALPATEGLTNTSVMTGSISAAVQSPSWSQGVSERVAWMVQGNFQTAELKLNPAHLGPLEIKLSVTDDKASVTFVTAHAPVKEAIDQALPRLREMLEQQGLSLADVDVSQYSDAQEEQAEAFNGQGRSTGEQASSEMENLSGAVLNESMVSVNDGLSIFV